MWGDPLWLRWGRRESRHPLYRLLITKRWPCRWRKMPCYAFQHWMFEVIAGWQDHVSLDWYPLPCAGRQPSRGLWNIFHMNRRWSGRIHTIAIETDGTLFPCSSLSFFLRYFRSIFLLFCSGTQHVLWAFSNVNVTANSM